MKRFAVIGVNGYVAPRHLRAIAEVGGELVATHDVSSSGLPPLSQLRNAPFFSDINDFINFLSKNRPDYLCICTPNDLHLAHIDLGLDLGVNVICEKPLVTNPTLLEYIKTRSLEAQVTVNTIMQLRKLPVLENLRSRLAGKEVTKRFVVDLRYITGRDDSYFLTWKGKKERSGGLVFNIGIHLFDLLIWLFGSPKGFQVEMVGEKTLKGSLELERADVLWVLSVDPGMVPSGHRVNIYRSLTIDGESIQFDILGHDLHTLSYKDILESRGMTVDDVRSSTEICHKMQLMLP